LFVSLRKTTNEEDKCWKLHINNVPKRVRKFLLSKAEKEEKFNNDDEVDETLSLMVKLQHKPNIKERAQLFHVKFSFKKMSFKAIFETSS
jgi:hypothetical protein